MDSLLNSVIFVHIYIFEVVVLSIKIYQVRMLWVQKTLRL